MVWWKCIDVSENTSASVVGYHIQGNMSAFLNFGVAVVKLLQCLGYGLDDPGFKFRKVQGIFLLLKQDQQDATLHNGIYY